ncbi:MAG: class I SAM-dependent methyltransferase [Thiobacillaceae bacterium]|jgi:SAM-dependent methyltransferase
MSPKKFFRFLRHAPTMLSELNQLKQQARHSSHHFDFAQLNPYPHEKKQQSGTARGHYFHQDLLVARRIHERGPQKHVDIGSRVDGFVAHVASFRNIEVLDIRPLDSKIHNIQFRQADLMSLPPHMAGYCDSLSCLHAIEHFGLGRYGDPIDFEGHIKGLNNLYTILKPGGTLYLSCPIGPQRIEFNAHRVFSLEYLMSLFEGKFKVETFSYVDDHGDLHENVALTSDMVDKNFDCNYGCGIFELEKV